MWVGSTGRSRENVSRTGFRLSLLCFQEAAPRRPHKATCRSDTRSHFRWLTRSSRRRPGPRTRALESGEKTLVSTGSVVPGPRGYGRVRRAGRGARLAIPHQQLQTPVTIVQTPWSGACRIRPDPRRPCWTVTGPTSACRSGWPGPRDRPRCTRHPR